MEVPILIHKENYNTCNFPGGGGGGGVSGSPDRTSLCIHNSDIKRISRNDRFSPNILSKGLQVDISNSVNLILWTKFKYNKANSTNLYPSTKGNLRETCKSQNINPIYLTLSSPTVSFRS